MDSVNEPTCISTICFKDYQNDHTNAMQDNGCHSVYKAVAADIIYFTFSEVISVEYKSIRMHAHTHKTVWYKTLAWCEQKMMFTLPYKLSLVKCLVELWLSGSSFNIFFFHLFLI